MKHFHPTSFMKRENFIVSSILKCVYRIIPRFFWAYRYTYPLCTLVELKGPHHFLGPCQKCFESFKYLGWLKMHLRGWARSFYKPCSKTFGLNIWAPIPIKHYKDTPGYDTGELHMKNSTVTTCNVTLFRCILN